VVASMTPKSSSQKEEGGPKGIKRVTFVVADNDEKIAEQEHKGVFESRTRDPSVQQVIF
jgi:hypothetical protein